MEDLMAPKLSGVAAVCAECSEGSEGLPVGCFAGGKC